jgi:hypothetical protein
MCTSIFPWTWFYFLCNGLDYVQTQPGASDHEIVAIDCEMVWFSKLKYALIICSEVFLGG